MERRTPFSSFGAATTHDLSLLVWLARASMNTSALVASIRYPKHQDRFCSSTFEDAVGIGGIYASAAIGDAPLVAGPQFAAGHEKLGDRMRALYVPVGKCFLVLFLSLRKG